VNVGQVVEIGLYVVADGLEEDQHPIQNLWVVLEWDPSRLKLLGKVDPCDSVDPCFVCPVGEYNWYTSMFPDDCNLDGLNAPCDGDPETPPDNDGNARYEAWAQWTGECPEDPLEAYATHAGVLVTLFQFEVLSPGLTQVSLADRADCHPHAAGCEPRYCCNEPTCDECSFTITTVVGGPVSGGILTGSRGMPALVDISACPPPTVEVIGSRYVAVTPAPGVDPVGLYVTGVDPEVACIGEWAREEGLLIDGDVVLGSPAWQLPDDWGTIHLAGANLWPVSMPRSPDDPTERWYNVQTDCSPEGEPGTSLSDPVSFTLWYWGDANNDGSVDFSDIGATVDGLRGVFHNTAMECPEGTDEECEYVPPQPNQICDTSVGLCMMRPQQVDFLGSRFPPPERAPCAPDLSEGIIVIDFSDVGAVVDAFVGKPYVCRVDWCQ
jgi:hypothetical protein